ncbi:MAG: hypothetical protein OWR62_10615 [Sulfobacillus thermotolerans]|nr:hypothetical protein [Sulfobacillus thermotolerans]
MKSWGISVDPVSPDLTNSAENLRQSLTSWHILQPSNSAALNLQLVMGPFAILSSAVATRYTRQAARILGILTHWPRQLSPRWNSHTLYLQLDPTTVSTDTLSRVAWGLFLWAAANDPQNPTLTPLYLKRSVEPVASTPAALPIPHAPIAASAMASQPLKRPHVTGYPSAPPPRAAATSPRRG